MRNKTLLALASLATIGTSLVPSAGAATTQEYLSHPSKSFSTAAACNASLSAEKAAITQVGGTQLTSSFYNAPYCITTTDGWGYLIHYSAPNAASSGDFLYKDASGANKLTTAQASSINGTTWTTYNHHYTFSSLSDCNNHYQYVLNTLNPDNGKTLFVTSRPTSVDAKSVIGTKDQTYTCAESAAAGAGYGYNVVYLQPTNQKAPFGYEVTHTKSFLSLYPLQDSTGNTPGVPPVVTGKTLSDGTWSAN